MNKALVAWLLASGVAHADATAVHRKISELRSLPEAERGPRTGAVAQEIATLPADEQLDVALQLAHLATEGDAGRDNLQAVTDTLGAAVPSTSTDKAATDAYATLAMLARYEDMRVGKAITQRAQYARARALLEQQDRDVDRVDFTLDDGSGTRWSKQALRGKVVVLNFWATWCPPCRAELPSLEAIAARSDDVVVLAVTDEDPSKVDSFLHGGVPHVHVLFDPTRATITRYHASSLPRTYVFGRDGKLAATAIDGRTQRQFEALLRKAGR